MPGVPANMPPTPSLGQSGQPRPTTPDPIGPEPPPMLREMGAAINARMGLNTWAAFIGSDQDAAVAGDLVMLAHEITPTLQARRANGIDLVAIHQQSVPAHFGNIGECGRYPLSRSEKLDPTPQPVASATPAASL